MFSSAAKANCSSINDLTCVCQNPTFLSSVGSCEEANCNTAELQGTSSLTWGSALKIPLTDSAEILAFSQELCKPVGGAAVSFTVNSTLPSATGRTPPSVTPFTGGASMLGLRVSDYVAGVMMWIIWIV